MSHEDAMEIIKAGRGTQFDINIEFSIIKQGIVVLNQ